MPRDRLELLRVAAHQDDAQAGKPLPREPGEGEAVHVARHDHVAQHQVRHGRLAQEPPGGGIAAVAQNRGIQLRSVSATVEGGMDLAGILGIDKDVRNGFDGIKVTYDIDADATPDEIKALVAQSQKRSAVYDIITNPTNVTVNVA